MPFDQTTLGALLSDPRIQPVAADAIRGRDLRKEELWNRTLGQIREDQLLSGDLEAGFDRLFRAAETGAWYYPLYSEEECRQEKARRGVSLVWFPSDDPEADNKPFLFVVPGGGFVNVWNLTEGWPIAAQFNRCGYHAFILTYQVEAGSGLLERNMEDFARALSFVNAHEAQFHVKAGRYITCGFSAGGYLVCLWNTEKGHPAFGLPAPQAVFPVYAVTSLRLQARDRHLDLGSSVRLYGRPFQEAAETAYEIPEHAELFPPCALFLSAADGLVNPEHSRVLASALEKLHIPVKLEIGPEGGHGFSDGTGMCMEGWIGRAIQWYEHL